jgi:hypothetical protein
VKSPRSLFRSRPHRNGDQPIPNYPVPPDRSHWAVCVPFRDHILHPVEDALDTLARQGVPVHKWPGCSDVGFCRSQMASLAMMEGRQSVLFIDSDTLFHPADAIRILERPEPVVAGVYAQKRYGKLNVDLPESIEEIGLGTEGGDYEVRGVGAGFLRIHAEAFQRLIEHHDLPCCTDPDGTSAIWQFFLPHVYQRENGTWERLGEDYSFCRLCRLAGIPVIADTRIELHHLGLYPYGWDEAAVVRRERSRGLTIPHFRPDCSAGSGQGAGTNGIPRHGGSDDHRAGPAGRTTAAPAGPVAVAAGR